MFINGELTAKPAVLPEQFENLTLKNALPSQTFLVRSGFMVIDDDGHGWIRGNADLDEQLIIGQGQIRVIVMSEGLVVDLYSRVGNDPSKLKFERGAGKNIPSIDDEDKKGFFPVIGYISNKTELEAFKKLYQEKFGQELTYTFAPQNDEALAEVSPSQAKRSYKSYLMGGLAAAAAGTVAAVGVLKAKKSHS